MKLRAAKWAMSLMPNKPTIWNHFGNETFRHPAYVHGSQSERDRILQSASQFRYEVEQEMPFQIYFGRPIEPFFRDKVVLDLGCLTGGRAVAWGVKYGTREMHGIDLSPEYIEAATRLARQKALKSRFVVAAGEHLPFAGQSYDTIASYDVLEHVRSVPAVLEECWRVLKTGGYLLVVFPAFLNPIEHHLFLATRTPALHWFFPGDILMKAYDEIISRRGEPARWYARQSAGLEPWERLHTINGTSIREFRKMIDGRRWTIVEERYPGLFFTGRRAQRSRVLMLVSRLNGLLAKIPPLREVLADRMVFVLERK